LTGRPAGPRCHCSLLRVCGLLLTLLLLVQPTSSSSPLAPTRPPVTPTSRPQPPTPSPSTSKFLHPGAIYAKRQHKIPKTGAAHWAPSVVQLHRLSSPLGASSELPHDSSSLSLPVWPVCQFQFLDAASCHFPSGFLHAPREAWSRSMPFNSLWRRRRRKRRGGAGVEVCKREGEQEQEEREEREEGEKPNAC